jgi:hypothetical protein
MCGAPGMVKVRCELTQTGSLAASKGVPREVESEGSLRQNKAVTNRNWVVGCYDWVT